jgi:hypothetical protein
MKASFHIIIIPFTLTGMLMAGVAFGNPVMLPQHPGYPMGKATDPVNGQSLANDPGRANAVGEKALNGAAAFDDRHVATASERRAESATPGKTGGRDLAEGARPSDCDRSAGEGRDQGAGFAAVASDITSTAGDRRARGKDLFSWIALCGSAVEAS